MAKRLIIGFAVLIAIWIAYFSLAERLRSDEDRVRGALREISSAFNEQEVGRVKDHLHPDWRDETLKVDRERLGMMMRAAFMRRGPLSGSGLNRRVELQGPGGGFDEIEVTIDGDRAEATFDAVFLERDGASYAEKWRGAFTCELRRVDGDWLLFRSRHETVSGRRPF
jgi:hypothetical protein